MKKILLLSLMLFSMIQFSKATPLPGTRWRLYDSINKKIAQNLTTGQSWAFNTSQITSRVQPTNTVIVNINDPLVGSFTIKYGYDSVLNATGTSFASANDIWAFFQATPTQSVTIVSSPDITYSTYTKYALDTTGQTIISSKANFYSYEFINTTSVPVYVKFYNRTTSTSWQTPQGNPKLIPANGTAVLFGGGTPLFTFTTAISIRCTTGADANNTGEPTTTTANQVIVTVKYK